MKLIHWFRDNTLLLTIALLLYMGFLAPALISAPSWLAIIAAIVLGYLLVLWFIAYFKSRCKNLIASFRNN